MKYPVPKNALYQFWLKLTQWFLKSRESISHFRGPYQEHNRIKNKSFSHLRVVFELLGFKLEHFKTFLTHEAQYYERLF